MPVELDPAKGQNSYNDVPHPTKYQEHTKSTDKINARSRVDKDLIGSLVGRKLKLRKKAPLASHKSGRQPLVPGNGARGMKKHWSKSSSNPRLISPVTRTNFTWLSTRLWSRLTMRPFTPCLLQQTRDQAMISQVNRGALIEKTECAIDCIDRPGFK